LPGKP